MARCRSSSGQVGASGFPAWPAGLAAGAPADATSTVELTSPTCTLMTRLRIRTRIRRPRGPAQEWSR